MILDTCRYLTPGQTIRVTGLCPWWIPATVVRVSQVDSGPRPGGDPSLYGSLQQEFPEPRDVLPSLKELQAKWRLKPGIDPVQLVRDLRDQETRHV